MFLGFVTTFMLPNTKGKSLEQINDEMEKKKKKSNESNKRERRRKTSETEMETVSNYAQTASNNHVDTIG